MVAPVTNYTKTSSSANYYSYRSGQKQAKPFNLVLSYLRDLVSNYATTGTGGSAYTPEVVSSHTVYTNFGSDAAMYGQAYERFKSKLSDRASIGVSLLELDQSVAMIAARSTQLIRFGKQLRRGNLVGASHELRLSAVPKGAKASKSFANNYLEFHFGWAPLIGDIHSAIDVLQSPVKTCNPKGSSSEPDKNVAFETPVKYRLDGNVGMCGSSYKSRDTYRYMIGKRRVTVGADVRVSNPNLWLANQLGLINPAVLVYELIPFSFVADWFINVEQFLSSGTDFYGLTLDKAFTSKSVKGRWQFRSNSSCLWWDGTKYVESSTINEKSADFVHFTRSTGISGPGLFVRPFKVWGWRRAAAAVSLLTQQLTR